VQRVLILLGLFLVAAGAAWPWLRRLPLGRLPGDLHFVRGNMSFHFPLMTCLVVSVVLSIVLWLLRR
jgi:uncharacterized protein HemY